MRMTDQLQAYLQPNADRAEETAALEATLVDLCEQNIKCVADVKKNKGRSWSEQDIAPGSHVLVPPSAQQSTGSGAMYRFGKVLATDTTTGTAIIKYTEEPDSDAEEGSRVALCDILLCSQEAARSMRFLEYESAKVGGHLKEAMEQEEIHLNVVARYGFLYEMYRSPASGGYVSEYWETFEMLKKALLCSAVILVEPGKLGQLAFAFVVNMVFLVLHVKELPFKKEEDNEYQSYGLLSIALTIFAGILLKAKMGDQSADGWNLFFINGPNHDA